MTLTKKMTMRTQGDCRVNEYLCSSKNRSRKEIGWNRPLKRISSFQLRRNSRYGIFKACDAPGSVTRERSRDVRSITTAQLAARGILN